MIYIVIVGWALLVVAACQWAKLHDLTYWTVSTEKYVALHFSCMIVFVITLAILIVFTIRVCNELAYGL